MTIRTVIVAMVAVELRYRVVPDRGVVGEHGRGKVVREVVTLTEVRPNVRVARRESMTCSLLAQLRIEAQGGIGH